jgi:hypothetical protein
MPDYFYEFLPREETMTDLAYHYTEEDIEEEKTENHYRRHAKKYSPYEEIEKLTGEDF